MSALRATQLFRSAAARASASAAASTSAPTAVGVRMFGSSARVASGSEALARSVRKTKTGSGSGSGSGSVPARKGKVDAETEAEEFMIPGCLLPAETHAPTHGVHVATLQLRSYTDSLQELELFTEFARKAAYAIGMPASRAASLPVRTSLWTVPRSPFVHKKSQENFQRKTHARTIKLWDANDHIVDTWLHFLRIHAIPGVGMKAELVRHHALGVGHQIRKQLERPTATKTTAPSSQDQIKQLADEIVNKEHEVHAAAKTEPASASESA